MYPATLPGPSNLCGACSTLDFGKIGFQFAYNVFDIKQRAKACGFCRMLWNLCERLNKASQEKVKLERYHSTLRMDDDNDPVLSIILGPGA